MPESPFPISFPYGYIKIHDFKSYFKDRGGKKETAAEKIFSPARAPALPFELFFYFIHYITPQKSGKQKILFHTPCIKKRQTRKPAFPISDFISCWLQPSLP